MWSPEDLNFADERIASIFVLSSWHELFYAFTPDSNQPRLHNTPSLIEELAAIAERWQFNSRYQSHAKTVQAELSQIVEDDADILGTIPEYRSGVEHLVDESSPVAILSGCKLLGEQKALYEDAILTHSGPQRTTSLLRKCSRHSLLPRAAIR